MTSALVRSWRAATVISIGAARESATSPAGRVVFVGSACILTAAPVLLILLGAAEAPTSPDSTATQSLWSALAPSLVAAALLLLISRNAQPLSPGYGGGREALVGQCAALCVLALLTPGLMTLAVASGMPAYPLYHLVKLALLLLAAVLVVGGALGHRFAELVPVGSVERLWRPVGRARWLMPLPAVVIFTYLAALSPLAPRWQVPSDVGAAFIVVAAGLTFVTANLLEEFFYRVLLQTRLEQLLGAWPGVLAGAVLFTLSHVPVQLSGDPALALPEAVAYHGAFGLFTGLLWMRYRNFWLLLVVHTAVNTLPLVVAGLGELRV
ncbi:CPBP family intramembrane glutamic endopeptidase [Salinispora vitiensis]|uniref:CPBP family intramembrane glutamic endopeptidase n=1 Tax=Salinispora vitiensis TaxID=999544 RepID=UPI00037307BA|nr:CPBP family intramembrane glutamic endopeptidase [Salinispora vitiensis]